MWTGDKARQRGIDGGGGTARVVRWLRWLARPRRGGGAQSGLAETLRLHLLGDLIDGAVLPDGVVELVVEDPHLSMRHLFDVRGGEIVAIDPGSTVPWTSIRGNRKAWTAALGPDRDVSQLHHTGEPQLAEGVLGAIERRRLCHDRDTPAHSVPDCL